MEIYKIESSGSGRVWSGFRRGPLPEVVHFLKFQLCIVCVHWKWNCGFVSLSDDYTRRVTCVSVVVHAVYTQLVCVVDHVTSSCNVVTWPGTGSGIDKARITSPHYKPAFSATTTGLLVLGGRADGWVGRVAVESVSEFTLPGRFASEAMADGPCDVCVSPSVGLCLFCKGFQRSYMYIFN